MNPAALFLSPLSRRPHPGGLGRPQARPGAETVPAAGAWRETTPSVKSHTENPQKMKTLQNLLGTNCYLTHTHFPNFHLGYWMTVHKLQLIRCSMQTQGEYWPQERAVHPR